VIRIFLLFAILALPAMAQAGVLSPVLIVKGAKKGTYDPVHIEKMHVTTRIVSSIATTTVDMTFRNKLDRVLEGSLVFPLPEGAVICRFALDIEGRLREGVIVARDKGRKVFESTVRRQIDPGLLEWVKGNNFRARIYPLPAKGTRRVVVSYEHEMTRHDMGFLYRLPLSYPRPIGHFSIEIHVTGPSAAPAFTLSPFKDLGFAVQEGGHVARTHFDDMTVDGEIALTVKTGADQARVYLQKKGKHTYFYVVQQPKSAVRPRKSPSRLVVLWDASGSSDQRDRKRELAVLEAYLKGIEGVTISLVPFAAMAWPLESFEGPDAVAQLLHRIRSLPRDGGTNLGALDLTAYKEHADEFLLFTDGNGNIGQGELRTCEKPVRIFSTSPAANHVYLRHLAETTGGEYFNLLRCTDAEVAQRLATEAFRFLRAEFAQDALADVRPASPRRVTGSYSVAGRVLKPGAELTLHYGFGTETLESCQVQLSAAMEDASGAVGRIWARRELARLGVFPEKNEKEMLALGRTFGIVTPATSLIVLDRVEDYVRHDILPPPELEDEFWKQVEKRKAFVKKTKEVKIAEVLARWKGLTAWWEKVFKYPPNLRIARKKSKSGRQAAGDDEGEGAGGAESEDDGGVEPEDARPDSPGPTPTPSPTPTPTPAPGSRAREGRAEERSLGDALGKKQDKAGGAVENGIKLKKWDPKTPYLAKLAKAGMEKAYALYLTQRKDHADSSAFYLDVADFFFDKGRKDLGLRVLTNIAEMELENHQLLRILGHRLAQIGRHDLARHVFRQVLRIRPEEPQSYRDLAHALASLHRYAEAVALLYKVVLGNWDGRFAEIDQIALVEMNDIVRLARKKGATAFDVDPRFLRLIHVDLRIILDWDADSCDMDLWVIEPSGEKCFYSNRKTRIGGRMSHDFTQGYGPEEYILRKAMPGKYLLQVNYYGNSQQVLAGATTIQILIIKNYGRENEERISITRRLRDKKEVLTIGDVTFGDKGGKKK
jgi:tetratricopeptide (TPR) repeat protein